MSSTSRSSGGHSGTRHDVWEQQIKQLRVVTRLLIATLLALLARLALSGVTTAAVVATVLIGVLLAVALRLTYIGHRLEP
jgi:hypothetical protein